MVEAIVAAVGGAGLALVGKLAHEVHQRSKFRPPGHAPIDRVRAPKGDRFPPVSGDPETCRFHVRYGIGEATHQWHSDSLTHAKIVWDLLQSDRASYPGALEFFDGAHRRGFVGSTESV